MDPKEEAALDLLASLVLEDGRRWGEAAEPFQWTDARAVLSLGNITPYHFLTRPRGGSKTTDLAGMTIAALLCQLPPQAAGYAFAADQEQAGRLLRAIEGFRDRTPELAGALAVEVEKVTAPAAGTFLKVQAADAAGTWGMIPHWIVVDEIAQWGTTPGPRKLWEAIRTSMHKVPGSRLILLTTAGDPAHWSRKVLDHALRNKLWRVHEVPGPAPWGDADRLEEQREALTESSWRRLYLNEWTADEDRLTTADDIAACVTIDGPLAPDARWFYAIGVDVGIKNDRTVGSVCHLEPLRTAEGYGLKVVLDRMQVWKGSRTAPVQLDEVEEWIAQASASFGGAPVIIDPWQAVGMAQRLRERGVVVGEFTFSASSVGRLALTLYSLLRDHALAIPNDPELIDELLNVRLRESSPGVYRMDHDPDKHDDRALSLSLAAHLLLEAAEEPVTEIVEYSERVEISPY